MENKNFEKSQYKDAAYPLYPVNEDIYQQAEEVESIDPEDISTLKTLNEGYEPDLTVDHSFERETIGDDLDIPNVELDDDQESIGSEDEENNYYSIGGDNHNNLEENKIQ